MTSASKEVSFASSASGNTTSKSTFALNRPSICREESC
jgi:hypothetical protein